MASYRYESSRIGDIILYEDKKLMVCKGFLFLDPCMSCFFYKTECSGIACMPHERDDRKDVIYREITY